MNSVGINRGSTTQRLSVDEKAVFNDRIDYAAIGKDILSYQPNDSGLHQGSGTSFAAPHVTGLIAALLDKDGDNYKVFEETDDSTKLQKVHEMLQDKCTPRSTSFVSENEKSAIGKGFLTYIKQFFLAQALNKATIEIQETPAYTTGGRLLLAQALNIATNEIQETPANTTGGGSSGQVESCTFFENWSTAMVTNTFNDDPTGGGGGVKDPTGIGGKVKNP